MKISRQRNESASGCLSLNTRTTTRVRVSVHSVIEEQEGLFEAKKNGVKSDGLESEVKLDDSWVTSK